MNMGNFSVMSWEFSGVPVDFIIGNDGLPYAVLPNEYEAEDYQVIVGQNPETDSVFCCGGLFNGVRLQETIGM